MPTKTPDGIGYNTTMTDNVNHAGSWDAYYEQSRDGWDLGGPTPVFNRLASNGRFEPGRMAVLGAGRGYDAREFSRHGFQVTAVDFASNAVNEMKRLAEADAPLEILQQDIFTFPNEYDASFDYILEYVCFCAIDPNRRNEYADVATRLLKPNGLFIDLAYPLDARKGGPPFSFSARELLDLFEKRGFKLLSRERPEDSISRRKHAEELFIFQKIEQVGI
jgi:SAM-dependent methyltransferase